MANSGKSVYQGHCICLERKKVHTIEIIFTDMKRVSLSTFEYMHFKLQIGKA